MNYQLEPDSEGIIHCGCGYSMPVILQVGGPAEMVGEFVYLNMKCPTCGCPIGLKLEVEGECIGTQIESIGH